jgi:putative transposase
VTYVERWTARAATSRRRLLGWLELAPSKFYHWRQGRGQPPPAPRPVPRDGWLSTAERQAILDFHARHPLDGYRRLAYRLLDAGVVAASPSTVYRALKAAGRLDRRWQRPTRKGTGFEQPQAPHEHWHLDISYVNVAGTFYCLASILDGYSRFLVQHELRPRMTEAEVELLVQRALEAQPGAKPRIITDNGPQFVARDFKEFVRLLGMTHVRTSPYYPQSNGKLERWHGSLKRERLRPAAPETLEEARRLIAGYVQHYNHERLHGALGYVTPADQLAGRAAQIFTERSRRLDEARRRRRAANHEALREVA